MLEIHLNEVIFAIITFSLLVVGLRMFLYKPIMSMLDKRKEEIDSALNAAEQARIQVASTEENVRAEIARSREQAEAILAEAKTRGESVREEIISAARAEALSLTGQAKAEIEAEKNRALADLKNQIADMALLAAEKVLAGSLTEAQQKSLLNQYVEEVGQLQ